MWRYLLCAAICIAVWGINGKWLVASSIITLRHKGKPEGPDPLATTTPIDTGIFRVVRHPLYLGTALWSIALMLAFQSVISVVLGGIAIFVSEWH
jgi:protein-S-isoprenylcysteine O-methyltransferase Ste14